MAKIKWKDDFSIGNQDLDQQHKKWIEIFNKANDQMLGNLPVDSIHDVGKDAVKEMIKYTKYHFAYEEKYMKEIEFPGRKKHKQIHDAFVKKIDDLVHQMRRGKYVLNSEIIKVVENWLVTHILNEDQKIIKSG